MWHMSCLALTEPRPAVRSALAWGGAGRRIDALADSPKAVRAVQLAEPTSAEMAYNPSIGYVRPKVRWEGAPQCSRLWTGSKARHLRYAQPGPVHLPSAERFLSHRRPSGHYSACSTLPSCQTARKPVSRPRDSWFWRLKGWGFILVTASVKSSISSRASRIFCGSGPTLSRHAARGARHHRSARRRSISSLVNSLLGCFGNRALEMATMRLPVSSAASSKHFFISWAKINPQHAAAYRSLRPCPAQPGSPSAGYRCRQPSTPCCPRTC